MSREDRDDTDVGIPAPPTPTSIPAVSGGVLEQFVALFNAGPRMRYPWLPAGLAIPASPESAGWENFLGLTCLFSVHPAHPITPDLVEHEAGHAAVAGAAYLRDNVEGRGAAGEEIFNELAEVLGLPRGAFTDGASAFFSFRPEYATDAFAMANGFAPTYARTLNDLPQILSQKSELLAYFKSMRKTRP